MALHALLLMFQYWFVLVLLWLQLGAAELVPITGAKPGCPDKCGNISIPYPFGIGEGCYKRSDWYGWYESFNVKCSTDGFRPPKPFYGGLEILDISVRDSIMKVNLTLANSCYDDGKTWATLGRFTFAESRNKFIAIGCNTIGYFTATKNSNYSTGCLSLCDDINDVTDGSCNGIGCCEISIEKGLKKYNATAKGFYIGSSEDSLSPCSYAFVVDESWFKFKKSYVKEFSYEEVPAVLQWTVGKGTCNEARRNLKNYVCGANTNCSEPAGNVPEGYLCHCKPGYEGNPYLTDGCQDIDECKNPDANPCKEKSANVCKNTEGSYKCVCPPNHDTQPRNDGSIECVKHGDVFTYIGAGQHNESKIYIGTIIGLLFLLVAGSWLYWVFRKKKLTQLKEKFFQQNGGLILQQLLKSEKSVDESKTAKIFTAAELSKVTKNFDESRILGQGGYGTVYKGIFPNGDAVAIKKSKVVDRTQIEQFINEVVVLSQVNHRNVVKLLGCCLETEVPLLVYEFVTNGTLFQHLHDHENRGSKLSWNNRLRIAAEVAGSLAHLHSSASIPIIHRDVKSSNVLLDNNYTAKVSDFGASRLVSTDHTQLTTLVQGTLGYLDPEYFHTSHLTEKSDVYSFGVLLAELLTGKKALSSEKPEEERSLAGYFLSSIKDDRLFQILDDSLACEGHTEQQQLKEVAELTKRCLGWKGEKRPTMKEVVMVLDGLRGSSKDPWIFDVEPNSNKEEKVHLLVDIELDSYTETSTSRSVTQESQVMQASLINTGR